ncbi:MAG: 16S rRNA (guanine(966)-N(2))-methyltransferase RsmD [Burkholderiales bacterium]
MAKGKLRKGKQGGSLGHDTGVVRVIGGAWRSRRISFPANQQIRPTPDRVRETLFNWLGQNLDGWCCLDLFAGAGALGFEAASRGASRVTLVDNNARVVDALANSKRLLGADQVNVVKADALEFLSRDGNTYDLVFLDPPFSNGPPVKIMSILAKKAKAGAMVYFESAEIFLPVTDWRIVKQGRAGMVHFQLLQLVESPIPMDSK